MTDLFGDEPTPWNIKFAGGHCEKCGRFAKITAVYPPTRFEDDEIIVRGICKSHGDVNMVWGRV